MYRKKIEPGRQDAEKWLRRSFENPQEMYFDFCIEVDDFEFVFDNFTADMIMRYRLLKEHQIYSFSNVYDELPAYWADALELMSVNYQLAIESKNAN